MQDLELLLNSLIKMGWKPWGKLVNTILYIHSKSMLVCLNAINEPKRQIRQDSLRELVSLESGLWQFVCENRVVKENDDVRIKNYQGDNECDTNCCYDDYEYRLLESALVPEEELEKFLLEKIIVDESRN